MGFVLTSADYVNYIKNAYELIKSREDYVTELDLATGDGDHWSNMNMGFEKLVEKSGELSKLPASDMLKEIGKTMMAVIGGSSGVLYGSAYLGAAKAIKGKETISRDDLGAVLKAMLDAIIQRGQSQENHKTMIDSLAPAVRAYETALKENKNDAELCESVKQAAVDGAENTKNMEAVKGRATYQANKGVGHLDPGAVTMSYQIGALMDYIRTEKLAG